MAPDRLPDRDSRPSGGSRLFGRAHKGLQWQAKRRLKQLDLHNVSTRHGDGWQGWPSRGPFDAIIVTAAPPEILIALIAQLAEGGIMVLAVGEDQQALKRLRRQGKGIIEETIEPVRFVPLVQGGARLTLFVFLHNCFMAPRT